MKAVIISFPLNIDLFCTHLLNTNYVPDCLGLGGLQRPKMHSSCPQGSKNLAGGQQKNIYFSPGTTIKLRNSIPPNKYWLSTCYACCTVLSILVVMMVGITEKYNVVTNTL